MRLRHIAALLALLVAALPAAAQEQGGSIQGVVKDAQGGVLPGVVVEARNTQGLTSRTVTDNLGVFRFPSLPPGSYECSATLTGFSPAKAAAVVTLGQLLRVDMTLRVGGLAESLRVDAETPLIDLKANAATASLNQETIDRIPKGRGYLSVLTQIPGTNTEARGGGLMIDGASGSENRFLVDGVDRTNARTGTALATTGTGAETPVVIQDFVETVQVKQSGYNAEFRAALGGVVSAITKSGSNSFHGSVGTYYTNNKYLGDIRPTLRSVPTDLSRAEYIKPPRDDGSSIDPVFSLGGPILKDKLWFFAGYSPQQSWAERTVTWANPLTFEKTQTFDNGSPYSRTANYNVSAQITSKLRARFTGSHERAKAALGLPAIEQDGTSTANAASFNPRPTVRTELFQNSYSGVLDWVASSKLYVNVTGAHFGYGSGSVDGDYYHGTRRTFTTTNVGMVGVPDSLQRVSGFADNPVNSFTVQDNYSRFNLSTDATWFTRWKGEHSVKVGVMYERIGNLANLGQQHANIAFNWNGTYNTLSNTTASGRYGFFTASRSYTGGDIRETNLSFFVQDQWTVSRKLTLNYGLRLENEEIPSYKPENPGVNFGWGDKIGPRLGFAYDIKGDGRWKAYGSWGVFYDTMKLEMPRGAWGGDHWIDYVYTLETENWPSIDCPEINGGTRCSGGTFIEQNDRRHPSNEIGNSLVDPNLKPTKKQEFTLGLDRELSSVMSVGVRYAHKWWNQTIDDVGVLVPGVGEVFYIANPGYGVGRAPLGDQFPAVPKVINKYDGLELVLRKRFSNKWQATSSVVFSRLFGNYGGLASSDENGRTSPNVSRYYDGLYMTYDQKGNPTNALLGTDRPIQFKLQGSYEMPWGTNIGANFFAMSGLNQSSTVTYATVPVFFNGRNDLDRTSMLSQTDLLLAHDFKIRGATRLSLQVNIANVFDQDTATRVATAGYRDALTIPGFPNNPGGAFFQPGGFDTVAIQAARLPASGRPNPQYKQANEFQGARSIRLLARISF